MWHTKQIELPTVQIGGTSDKYTLTKEAVKLIKEAHDIVINYESFLGEQSDSSSMMIHCKDSVRGEFIEFCYVLPINMTSIDLFRYDYRVTASTRYLSSRELHPLQALVKEGDILVFEPYRDAFTTSELKEDGYCIDVINWQLWRGKNAEKVITGFFSSYCCKINNPTRAIIRTDRRDRVVSQ